MLDSPIADTLSDESVGWPTYVDFLASFAFVLILFVTWAVILLAGEEQALARRIQMLAIQQAAEAIDIKTLIEGEKLRIPLKNKVIFGLNRSDLNDEGRSHLRKVGHFIARNLSGLQRILVMGYADNVPAKLDPFFNWSISVARAQEVLRFLYLCSDCGYPPEKIRPMLMLQGTGDLDSRILSREEHSGGNPDDRRVDIVLDWGVGDRR